MRTMCSSLERGFWVLQRAPAQRLEPRDWGPSTRSSLSLFKRVFLREEPSGLYAPPGSLGTFDCALGGHRAVGRLETRFH